MSRRPSDNAVWNQPWSGLEVCMEKKGGSGRRAKPRQYADNVADEDTGKQIAGSRPREYLLEARDRGVEAFEHVSAAGGSSARASGDGPWRRRAQARL